MPKLTSRTNNEVPPWTMVVLAKFGKTPYSENNYRIVWGWDRMEKFETPEGVKDVPRYQLETDGELNRWILEKWIPSAEAEEDGRFGYFEFCHLLQTEKGNFVPLDRTYLELIVTLLEKGRESYDFKRNKAAILQRMADADKAHEMKQDAILNESFADVRRHIAMNPSALNDVKLSHGVEHPRIGIHQMSEIPKFRRM